MEDCNSNTPTGPSGQVSSGGGRDAALARRNAAAREYEATGSPTARDIAIEADGIAQGHDPQRPAAEQSTPRHRGE